MENSNYRIPHIDEFVRGFEYQVLTNISSNVWEDRMIVENTCILSPTFKQYLQNEIKLKRVRVICPMI